jgi:hypothetical protein
MKTSEVARITNVKVLDGFRLRLTFKDSARRIVDLESILWGPMFAPLRKPSEFRKVRVNPEFGCIEWPNGADLCPDALRDWCPSRRKSVLSQMESGRPEKLIARYNSAHEEEKRMNKADKAMARKLRCSRLYKLKVKSKKTGKWEFRLFGCSRKGLESTAKFYKEKFGKQAKVVQA